MADALLKELPRDLPSFLERFGTDAQCRAYLVRARWPDGFRCAGCGHDRAWSHHRRLIEECRKRRPRPIGAAALKARPAS